MVLYFSGTGNSRLIAERISAATGDALLSLNEKIKHKENTLNATDGERLIFVTPTYAWRIPRVVEKWIRETDLRAAGPVWFVMNCGDEIGNADLYLKKLCADKGLRYMGVAKILMPENYIAMFDAPREEQAQEIICEAEPAIDKAIRAIVEGKAFDPPASGFADRIKSRVVNPVFYKLFVKADPFFAADSCIGCGACVRLCPLNNIRLENGKPKWGKDCTHCMACICHCPVLAIEYGKKSEGKPRYHVD